MRKIDFIALHCTDSDNPKHNNIKTVKHWHVVENGWSDIGYNFLVLDGGQIEIGRPIHLIPAHIKGFNKNSVSICLTGSKNFTEEQFESTSKLVGMLLSVLGLTKLDVLGHNTLDSSKTCPNFDLNEIIKRL